MERIWIYYYSFLLLVLLAGLAYFILQGISHSAAIREHHIGTNLTKVGNRCIVTWLGGWDFDSFYTNVTVNDVNVGHPEPSTVIYNDTCKDLVVKMHDKAVHYDMELYRYNHTGSV